MLRSALIATLAVATTSAACATSDPESASGAESALIGAASDTNDPAVVVLTVSGSAGGDCTAEFISTTVLLTAAHCLLTESGKPLNGATFRIYRGPDVARAAETDWITIDPSNVHPHPSFRGQDHDVGVLVLSHPLDVTPLPWSTRALSSSDVGKSVRLVGYGATVVGSPRGDDGFGKKRQLTTKIDSIATAPFVYIGKRGQTACSGDSGGPALMNIDGVETIIGLDSYSNASVDCTKGEYYQRVDTEKAFISQYLTQPSGTPSE